MKRRPILFSTEMVKAIRRDENPKTQTRRILKPRLPSVEAVLELSGAPFSIAQLKESNEWWVMGPVWAVRQLVDDPVVVNRPIRCPYGPVGDRLWVREAWRPIWDTEHGRKIEFRAGGTRLIHFTGASDLWSPESLARNGWRPSIHMPRFACRMELEVTDVAVERLQSISESGIRHEGCPDEYWIHPFDWWIPGWDALNAKRGYGWNTNPWVWVVEFKRVEFDR